MTYARALGALAVVSLIGAGCGEGEPSGTGAAAPTVIEITMTDNAFTPDAVEVSVGEEVTFRFRNDGGEVHEAVLGDVHAQNQHAAEMARMAEDEHGHGDRDHGDMDHGDMGHEDMELGSVRLQPGERGEVVHRFDEPGELLFGCHEPGHFEDGMQVVVTVT